MAKNDERFDVVIYEIETGVVDSIAGKDMPRSSGFHNAEKRIDTVIERLNERYNASIVGTGKYEKGDVLDEDDQ